MRTIARAVKIVAASIACSFLYVRFLTTHVPSFLSLMEWSIIGVVVAVIVGSICRLFIHSGTIMGALAVAAVVAATIWTEFHFSFPLSHDTAESSTWFARI